MQGLSERMKHFETGVFAALTLKQNELKARGKEVYPLFVGTPRFCDR